MKPAFRMQAIQWASVCVLTVAGSSCFENGSLVSASRKPVEVTSVNHDTVANHPSSISLNAPVIGSFTVPAHLRTTSASVGVMYNLKKPLSAAVGGDGALDALLARVPAETTVAAIPVAITPAGGGMPVSIPFGTLVDASHKLKNLMIVHPNGYNLFATVPTAPDTARVLQADHGDFYLVGGMSGVSVLRGFIRVSQDAAHSLPSASNAVYGGNALPLPTQYPDTSAITPTLVSAYSSYGATTTDLLVKLYVGGQVQYKVILRTSAGTGLLICWTVASCASLI